VIRFKGFSKDEEVDLRNFIEENSEYLSKKPDFKSDVINMAVDNNGIVALCLLQDNHFHPYRKYSYVYVPREYRGNGIGSELHDFSVRQSGNGKYQFATSSDDDNAKGFLHYLNYKLARKCFEYEVVEKDLIHVDGFPKLDMIPLINLQTSDYEKVIQLNYRHYRRTHDSINPLNEAISVEKWKDYIEEEIDLKSSFTYFQDDLPVFYAFLTKPEDEEIELMYFGAEKSQSVSDVRNFYLNMFNRTFEKNETIIFEVDDVDKIGIIVTGLFKRKPPVSWDTYILNK